MSTLTAFRSDLPNTKHWRGLPLLGNRLACMRHKYKVFVVSYPKKGFRAMLGYLKNLMHHVL